MLRIAALATARLVCVLVRPQVMIMRNKPTAMQANDHAFYMKQALDAAIKTTQHVSPNPKVGCVIVCNQDVIATGYHNGPGSDHAEIMALKQITQLAENTTLYVTLEPCCHTGRTPPCTNAIIASGIRHVVIAMLDPNPLVNGKGVKALETAGIQITLGILDEFAQALNRTYCFAMIHQRSYCIAKWAMSLDGYRITHSQDDKHISNTKSQREAHQLRQTVDAILIGKETAIQDDPRLTTRLIDHKNPHHPIRLILASKGNLPLSLRVFDPELPGKTVLVCTQAITDAYIKQCKNKNIDVWIMPTDDQGKIDLLALLNHCYQVGIHSVLVEGGPSIQNAFFSQDLIQEIHSFIAPVVIATLPQKKHLSHHLEDVHVHGYC